MWALLAMWSAAQAHNGAVPLRGIYDWSNLPDAEPWAWWVWEFYPSVTLGCLAFLVGFEALAGPLRERWALSPAPPTRSERVRFYLSIAVVFFSLQGPLHDLAEVYLFSAHMVQHLLITLVFPPMMLGAMPGWMWTPILEKAWARAVGRAITHPLVAVLFCTAILYLWHVPAMYDWALFDHNVHIAEHLTFMTGYVVLWWPAFSRSNLLPALTPGWKMVYLFGATLPMKGLGAILTMSDYVLYTFYAAQPRVSSLDPLADQRLGGLIMWLPGGLVFWVTIGYVFFTQYYSQIEGERNARPVGVGGVA